MTTMTINIRNSNILESLKQVLSNLSGVEILSVNDTADEQDEEREPKSALKTYGNSFA